MSFQSRVGRWVVKAFGQKVADHAEERNYRFIEEALELVQACGASQTKMHEMVDYVYGRPPGEIHQEIGGVLVTLAALCNVWDRPMKKAGEDELKRCWQKIDVIRGKQNAKLIRGTEYPT